MMDRFVEPMRLSLTIFLIVLAVAGCTATQDFKAMLANPERPAAERERAPGAGSDRTARRPHRPDRPAAAPARPRLARLHPHAERRDPEARTADADRDTGHNSLKTYATIWSSTALASK